MRYVVAIVLLFTATSDSIENTEIATRHDVEDSRYLELGAKYPATVRVGETGGDGTLIAPNWVLTAAHVAEGMVRRGGGTVRVFVDGQDEGYEADKVILHPAFAPMGPNDIALIRLVRPVEDVVPVGLYRDTDEQGKRIVLVGHGDTKRGSGGDWVRDGRRRGATNVIDTANDAHIVFDFDEPRSATALEGTAGPGDSGGPALIEVDGVPLVAGVSSLGEPGANGPGTYGAREHYVRVSSHADWIDALLADPPKERLVNMPQQEQAPVVRRIGPGVRSTGPGGPGNVPQGVVVLEEIGLLVAERDGQVRMVGRIDERFPSQLLEGGIRPPAAIVKIDDKRVESAQALKATFDSMKAGSDFTLEFEHGGKNLRFELRK